MGQMDHRDIFRTRLTGYVALFWFTRGISFFHSEFSDFLESDRKAHSSAFRLTTLCRCKIRIVTTRTFLFYAFLCRFLQVEQKVSGWLYFSPVLVGLGP